MRRALVGSLLLGLATPAFGKGPEIRVEKATIAWGELKRLIEADGDSPPVSASPTPPPHAYASTASVDGQVEGEAVSLRVVLDLEVLADRWVLVPVLPANLAVSAATVNAPPGRRGLLVRESGGVLVAASGAGHYVVVLETEGALEPSSRGGRLALPLPGLTGGQAHIAVSAGRRVSGRTPWRSIALPGGRVEAQAALGAEGLDLVLGAEDLPTEAAGSLDGLDALSVVSLGGTGVTRITFHATPPEGGSLALTLPPGARLWKAFVDGKSLEVAHLGTTEAVQIPLRHPSQVELAYTFTLPPLGLRGRVRVELPCWPVPVRDAAWQLWLPTGLRYSETQAALGPLAVCPSDLPPARTALSTQGQCLAFARPVLDPGVAYVESAYEEPL